MQQLLDPAPRPPPRPVAALVLRPPRPWRRSASRKARLFKTVIWDGEKGSDGDGEQGENGRKRHVAM